VTSGPEERWRTFFVFNRMNATARKEVASPGSTILVVESNVIIRMAVSAYLRECGYKVIEASDAVEATQVLEADIKIDIVFTEVDLPGQKDGFALATWIRRERPAVKVVLTSGVKRSAKDAGTLCEEGPILAKPYDHGRLERHIRQLLAAGAA
jgi:CheY-like chemotaxis protein